MPSDAADNPEPMPLRVAARVQVAATVICPPIVAPYRLGSLCKRGHDHARTGMTLRYMAKGKCSTCSTCSGEREQVREPRDREYRNAATRKWRAKGAEKRAEKRAERLAAAAEYRLGAKSRQAAYRLANADSRAEYDRQYAASHADHRRTYERSRWARRNTALLREIRKQQRMRMAAAAFPHELQQWRATIYEVNSQLKKAQKASKQR